MEWIQNHWAEIGAIAATVLLLADSIAKLTTTKKDDRVIEKIKAAVPVLWPSAGKKDKAEK